MPKSDSTKIKHLKILRVYESVKISAGEYAPFLSQGYYIDNTINECVSLGINGVSRSVVYKALKDEKKLKDEEFLFNDCRK